MLDFDIIRPKWMLQALCRGKKNETPKETKARVSLFYPTRGGSVRIAKDFCKKCPVKDECLEYAFFYGIGEKFGIWGGTSELERRPIRAERKVRTQG